MSMKPILFSTQMVQAILAGRKTQTRRIIKSNHESGLFMVGRRKSDGAIVEITSLDWDESTGDYSNDIQPKYKVGDILWVRETWAQFVDGTYTYKADGFNQTEEGWIKQTPNRIYDEILVRKWKPSIHMPRAAARIFLEVTNVRAEKLGEINSDDCFKEGAPDSCIPFLDGYIMDQNEWFKQLWQSINKEYDPETWVWVYEFKRINKPQP